MDWLLGGLVGWLVDPQILRRCTGPQLPVNWSQVPSHNSAQLDGQLFSSNHPFNSVLNILTVHFDTRYINWMDGPGVKFPWWPLVCGLHVLPEPGWVPSGFLWQYKDIKTVQDFCSSLLYNMFLDWSVNCGLTRVLKIPQRLWPKFCFSFTMNTLQLMWHVHSSNPIVGPSLPLWLHLFEKRYRFRIKWWIEKLSSQNT